MKISKQKYLKSKSNLLIGFMAFLLLIVGTSIVYWNVGTHEFVNYDDPIFIDNSYVQKGINKESVFWAVYFSGKNRVWIPVAWLSHMLDYQLFGRNPGLHHLVNLILHIASSIILYLLFYRATGELLKSMFIAAIFALHPINVEPVAWIAARKDVLSALFWMLTTYSYVIYTERPNLTKYLLTIIFFILGLMAKPNLIILTFVFILLDYWPLNRFNYSEKVCKVICKLFNLKSPIKNKNNSECIGKTKNLSFLLLEKLPFLILSAIPVWLSLDRAGNVLKNQIVPLDLRISNAIVSYIKYIWEMIFPKGLTYYYPYPDTIPGWKALSALLFIIGISYIVIRAFRTKPYLITGWFWYIGSLIPSIGIVQMGIHPAMADRYAYIPFIGLFLIVVWGIPDIMRKWVYHRLFIGILIGTYFSVFVMTSWNQIQYWKNSITLNQHALEVTENNHIAHNGMGTALFKDGRYDEAMDHYIEALRIKPDSIKIINNIGLVYLRLGDIEKSVQYFRKAYDNGCTMALLSIRKVSRDKLKIDTAIRGMRNALELKSDGTDLFEKLKKIHSSRIELNRVIRSFAKSLLMNPEIFEINFIKNNSDYAKIKKDYQNTLSQFIEGSSYYSEENFIYYNIACIYSMENDIEKAILWLERAIDHGDNDYNLIKADTDLKNIRKTLYYKKLVKQ